MTESRSPRTTPLLYALLLTVVPAMLWLSCWPFANAGVNDDFSYAFTVKRLIETGHFTYNAWSSAMLGAQALWAVPFIKTLGFSHDVLRFSTLPLAIGCAWLTYALHRRFHIARSWSVFAALLVTTSPLFTPWSASFMTDVPGLFLTLALFHAVVSLRRATPAGQIVGFAIALAVIGLLGGTVRQTLFIFAGVAFALELFMRRHVRRDLVSLGIVALVYIVAAVWLIKWNASQPYYIAELRPGLRMLPRSIPMLIRLALDSALYLLPLLLAMAARRTIASRKTILILGLTAIVVGVCGLLIPIDKATFLLAPWTGNTVTIGGLLSNRIDAPGTRPVVLGAAVRAIATVATFAAIILVGPIVRRRSVVIVRDAWQRFGHWNAREGSLVSLAVLGVVYACLLVPRASFGMVFDRYMLVLMPLVSLVALLALRGTMRSRPSPAGWALLALYAIFGVAITFDHFAELRARATLADTMVQSGVARDTIVNGIVFDGWTQLERRGYLNDERLKNPPGAFRPDPHAEAKDEIYWFLSRTPAIKPVWIISNVATPPTVGPDDYATRFRTLLPPYHRWIVARSAGDAMRSAATSE